MLQREPEVASVDEHGSLEALEPSSQLADQTQQDKPSVREIVPPETGLAFPALNALRPHLANELAFVCCVDEVQRAEGYRIVGVFENAWVHASAISGFRVAHNIAWGRFSFYI